MRVLFVYPNLDTQMGFNHGLASLSACLQRAGHETRLVNLNENLPPVPSREDLLALVRAWRPGLLAFSCLTQQYAAALELARRHPAVLFATAGVHPHHAADYTAETDALLRDLAAQDEVVAVGETGLDYFRDFSPRDAQRDAF